MLGFLSCHLCLVFEGSSFVLVAQKAPASCTAPGVSFWALQNWWLPNVWRKPPGVPHFSHSSVHSGTGVTFSAEIRKYLHVACSLFAFISLLFISFYYWAWKCFRYFVQITCQACDKRLCPLQRVFTASALAPRAICPFPCARGMQENPRTGNKWSAAVPGCCRGAGSFPGSYVRGNE